MLMANTLFIPITWFFMALQDQLYSFYVLGCVQLVSIGHSEQLLPWFLIIPAVLIIFVFLWHNLGGI